MGLLEPVILWTSFSGTHEVTLNSIDHLHHYKTLYLILDNKLQVPPWEKNVDRKPNKYSSKIESLELSIFSDAISASFRLVAKNDVLISVLVLEFRELLTPF